MRQAEVPPFAVVPPHELLPIRCEEQELEENLLRIDGRVPKNHRDFAAARGKAATLRRYLGKLYAKEMVRLNFPDLGAPESMERLIELIMRMEYRL